LLKRQIVELQHKQRKEVEPVRDALSEPPAADQGASHGLATNGIDYPLSQGPTGGDPSDQIYVTELERKLKEQSAEMDRLQSLLDAQQQQLQSAQQNEEEVKNLALAYSELEDVLRDKDTEIATLQASLASNEATSAKGLQHSLVAEDQGDSKCKALEAQVKHLQAELKKEKVKYESLEEEQKELLIALAELEIENNNLKCGGPANGSSFPVEGPF